MGNFNPEVSITTTRGEKQKGFMVKLPENMPLEEKAEIVKAKMREFMKQTFYQPCNIYHSAKIGKNVKVGMFAEVGHNVYIGDNVSIGKGAFLCEGVVIENDVFIGPHVCFSNDMYPPSDKKKWQNTLIKKGASIGANVSIRPGVTIGENAIIGMGSVVTKNVPAGEIWAGNPCAYLRKVTAKNDS